jgi:hypothetical protein
MSIPKVLESLESMAPGMVLSHSWDVDYYSVAWPAYLHWADPWADHTKWQDCSMKCGR